MGVVVFIVTATIGNEMLTDEVMYCGLCNVMLRNVSQVH